jgi:hypothetical protein
MRFGLPLFLILFAGGSAFGQGYVDCFRDSARQKLRSQELQDIVNADQADRQGVVDWSVVAPRDEARRKRVGEIFGEGCIRAAADFAAAALVFQHGDVPEHYYQAYLFAKRAVELGDANQKHLMADGIDRYLISTGHKQLYATQGFRPSPDACHCLDAVEMSFPDQRRRRDANWSLKQGFEMVTRFDEGKNCGRPRFCDRPLAPTPRGSVPGVW